MSKKRSKPSGQLDWFDKNYLGGGTKSFGGGLSHLDDFSFKGHKTGRCYMSHPPLKLPGTDLVVYGGSCISPSVTDADVYIGFDGGMKLTKRQWPWSDGDEVFFKITDMQAPDNPDDFRKLVEWARAQIEAGRKVHAGCIGGHGRTGTFLAALVSTYGEADAITYVRKNYCTRAVESADQVKFLQKHFGVKPVGGAKEWGGSTKSTGKSSGKSSTTSLVHSRDLAVRKFVHLSGPGSIW